VSAFEKIKGFLLALFIPAVVFVVFFVLFYVFGIFNYLEQDFGLGNNITYSFNTFRSDYVFLAIGLTSVISVLGSSAALFFAAIKENCRSVLFWRFLFWSGLIVSFLPAVIFVLTHPVAQQIYHTKAFTTLCTVLFLISFLEYLFTYIVSTAFAPRKYRYSFFPFARITKIKGEVK